MGFSAKLHPLHRCYFPALRLFRLSPTFLLSGVAAYYFTRTYSSYFFLWFTILRGSYSSYFFICGGFMIDVPSPCLYFYLYSAKRSPSLHIILYSPRFAFALRFCATLILLWLYSSLYSY